MSNRVWVTLATNDSYGLGALVLAHSLRRAGSAYPAVVLITPAVTESMRDRLRAVFADLVIVDVLDSLDAAHLALLQRPELGITFTKLHCWNLTQYEKCVFLDADTLVIQNCDELFDREELSAAPDVGWPDCFNSGVFVFRPSADTFNELIKFAQERGSFDGGDQGLLNSFFSDWAHGDINKHLPFLYNVTSAAFYSYLPALKHFGQNLKIIHFIGAVKPWLQPFNWDSRSVSAPDHLRELLQLWWDLFVSQVHSQLDVAMSGVAGNLARVVAGGGAQRDAVDELTRRQGWEAGNIDYMGADSFDNIWAKISQTLNQPRPSPPRQPAVQPQPEVSAAPPVVNEAEITPASIVPDTTAPTVEAPVAPVVAPATVATPVPVEVPAPVAIPADAPVPAKIPATVEAVVPVEKLVPVEPAVEAVPSKAAVPEQTVPAPAAPAVPAPAPVPVEVSKTTETKAPVEAKASVEAKAPVEAKATEAKAPAKIPVPSPVPIVAAAEIPKTVEAVETAAIKEAAAKESKAKTETVGAAAAVPAAAVIPKTVAKADEVATVAASPEKASDSPPLANTPSKEGAPPLPAAKSEERRKPAGKLQLRPPAAADPLPTPDSELEDAAELASSIIAGELRTPTVTAPASATPPTLHPLTQQEKRLSVEEPDVLTPPIGAVSLAQIGVKPAAKGKASTAAQIESSVAEGTEAPRKKLVKKVVKKEAAAGDAPVPPPRKKEKKPKDK